MWRKKRALCDVSVGGGAMHERGVCKVVLKICFILLIPLGATSAAETTYFTFKYVKTGI